MRINIPVRLLALRSFALSVIVSMAILTTFSGSVSAQSVATDELDASAASSVPAQVDLGITPPPLSVPAQTDPAITPPPLLRNTFNHMTTGFPLSGMHISVACETCHVGGTFKGTPKACAGCHTIGRLVAATPKTQDHIPTTKGCDACHASAGSFETAVMDHTGLTQPCAVCHSGSYSSVKSAPSDTLHNSNSSLATPQPCDSCHKSTFTFAGSRFDHSTTTSDCANCHNGTAALGKSATHIPTVEPRCEACHTPAVTPGWPNPTSFLGAVFDATAHTAAGYTIGSNTCATCHGPITGVKAKSSAHIATTLQCDICHTSTTSFASNWTMNHAANGNSANCASCHTGATVDTTVVLGKPAATHIVTSLACEVCHTDTSSPGGFKVWTMSHNGITTGCSSCHGGQSFQGSVPNPPTNETSITVGTHVSTKLECTSCHSSTNTGTGGFASGWTMNHSANGNTSGCALCHTGASVGTAVVIGEPSGHIVTGASVACESCHASTSNSTGGFAAPNWTMNHAANGNTSGCATCHAAGVTLYNAPTLVTLSSSIHVPVGSTACENCHSATSTGTGGFTTGWAMGTTGHGYVSGTTCATCHDTGVAYTGVKTKSNTHIGYAAGIDCVDCHTSSNTSGFTTFLNATFDHSTTTAACSTCHGDAVSTAKTKSSNHISTTQECSVCHTNTTTFANPNPAMNHAGITTGCASCHNGSNAGSTVTTNVLGKLTNHITTSLACETCHTSTASGGFAGGANAMNHTGITSGCASCHNGTNVGDKTATVVLTKPPTHIPTSLACETCHTTAPTGAGPTGDYTKWTMNHAGITTGCSTCHGGQTFGTAALVIPVNKSTISNHVSTTLECTACHSATSTGTGGFAAPNWTMNHSANNNTTNCASCHSQNGDTTVGNNTTVKGKPTATNSHVPTLIACESCHSITGTGSGGFATGWTMNHSANGNTSNCSTCHNGTTSYGVTVTTTVLGKPTGTPGHIPTGSTPCESCHSATSTSIGGFAAPTWTMNHSANGNMPSGGASTCATCHNGQTFQGATVVSSTSIINPHPGGAPTSDCGTCHGSVTSFLASTTYNHLNVTAGSCSSCHNGVIALGKPAGHLTTSASCDTCHTNQVYTTGGFLMNVDHSNLGANAVLGKGQCASSCHNDSANQITKGASLPTSHIPIPTGINSVACDACHTNQSSFTAWSMNHGTLASGCETCHAASYPGVMVKPSYHITVAGTATCVNCHPATTAGLSSGGFAAPNWTMNHAANNNNVSGCATCHLSSGNSTLGSALVKGKSANHIPLTAPTATTCESCHNSTTTFASPNPAMTHTGIKTGCASCHNGTDVGTTVSTIVLGKPGAHIPTSLACESCHTTAPSAAGPIGDFTKWSMSHTGITSGCASCHAFGSAFYNAPTLVTLSTTNHVPVGNIACESCHSSTNTTTGSFATAVTGWSMGANGHALVSGTACATCHNDSAPYTGVVKQNSIIPHLATSAACDTCHTSSNTNGFTSFLGAMGAHTSNPVPALGASCNTCHTGGAPGSVGTGGGKNVIVNHVPIGTLDCSSCHTWSSFTLWNAPAVHAAVTGKACASCHDAGLSYVGVVTKSSAANHIPTSIACDSCHTSTVSPNGFTAWTMNHSANGNTSGCASCHANGASFTNNGVTPIVTLSTTNHVPVGSVACEQCHSSTGTGTGGFSTAWTMGTTGHALVTGTTCASCHDTGVVYTGVKVKSSSHIAYTSGTLCSTCHTQASTSGYTNFLNAAFDHSSTTAACSTCHGGSVAGVKIKSPNHISTSLECNVCHTAPTGVAAVNGFNSPNPAMSHTGITTACASCHNGGNVGATVSTIVLGQPANHIPTSQACETCHTNAPAGVGPIKGFGAPNPAMNHNGITTGCATCHNGSNAGTTVTTIVLGKPSYHISTSLACEACHTTAPTGVGPVGGFATPNWTMNHAGITSGCATCHLQSGDSKVGTALIKGQPAAHVATTTACESCHSVASTGTGGFAAPSWTMNHAANGNISNCASCHLQSGDTKVGNATVKGKPSGHIAIPAAVACESCHSTGSTAVGGFAAPNWTMNHDVLPSLPPSPSIRCDSCHNGQTFLGATVVNSTSQNSPHPTTVPISGADCGTCHGSVTSFLAATTYTHTGVKAGTCSACHDTPATLTPVGLNKPSAHVTTSASCDTCHTNGVFTPGGFLMTVSHTNLGANAVFGSGKCATSCHNDLNNQTNLGAALPTSHIPIPSGINSVACDACHTNQTSFTAWSMNHGNISSGCETCHAATYPGVMVKPAYHITITTTCVSCHPATTAGLASGGFASPNWSMNHTANGNGTSGCASCHLSSGDNTLGTAVVKGKTTNHIPLATPTPTTCESCHTSTTIGGFAVPNPTMLHDGIKTGCASCHNGANVGATVNTVVLGQPTGHITTSAACETCHTTAPTGVGPVGGFVNWSMNHTGTSSGCASCHLPSGDNTVGIAVIKGEPSGHIATVAACEKCHTATPTAGIYPVGSFASWTMDHASNKNTTGCASCHDTGKSYYNAPSLVTLSTTAHVPVTGIACESCHLATNTATNAFATSALPMGATGHGLVAGTACAVCHDTGATYTGVVTKSSSHVGYTTGTACSVCHTSGNTNGYTTFLNATFDHSTTTAACSTCHGGNITGVKGKSANHIATSQECNVCHTAPTGVDTKGFVVPNPAMDHKGITTGCASCHNGSNAGTTVTTTMLGEITNHVATALACETCHTTAPAGVGPIGGFSAWTMNHAANGNTANCASCHLATGDTTVGKATVKGKPSMPANHVQTSLACESCHANTSTGTGGFAAPNWTMNHAANGNTSNCATCHLQTGDTTVGNTTVKGKPQGTNHVTTLLACESCHSINSTATGGFAAPNWTMNHTANSNTTNCASCHLQTGDVTVGTTTVKGKPKTHIATPATVACESCHSTTSTGTGGFASPGWTMNHAILPSLPPSPSIRCDSCHGQAVSTTFQGASITNQSTFNAHPVPVVGDCGSCHGSVTSFISSTTYTHAGVVAGTCSSCHDGVQALGKPAGHLATSASCDTCHTNQVYTTGGFQMTVSHTNLGANAVPGSGKCATSCHNDSANQITKGASLPTTHIPMPTGVNSIACDACHTNQSSFTAWSMNHGTVTSGCETCHAASFAGVMVKPSYHITVATTTTCVTCHPATTAGLATGGFAAPNWKMDHINNGNGSSGCATCHLASGDKTLGTVVVKGKSANHIPLAAPYPTACESCHSSTTSFATPNPAMSHGTGTTGCASCHNGGQVGTTVSTIVLGKPATHITTSLACEVCHTTAPTNVGPIGDFTKWTMSHTGITTGCATCHAAGKSFASTGGTPLVTLSTTAHVPVGSIACESCHSPGTTAVGAWTSTPPTGWTMGATGHALVTGTTCAGCHADSTTYTGVVKENSIITHIATTAACDTCHTSSNTGGYANFLGATGAHTSLPVGTCISCHGGGTAGTFGTGGGKNMVANHIPIGTLDCGACHAWSSFTTWTSPAVHTAVTGTTCATCHDAGKTYVGVVTKSTPAITHVATTIGCDSCHTSTTYAAGSFNVWTMNHAANSNTTACATCHASGKSFTNNGGTALVTLSTTIHVPVGTIACETCHSGTAAGAFATGAFASSTAWTMGTTGHNAVAASTPACASCHGATATAYTGVKLIDSAHIPSSYYPVEDCGVCHTAATTNSYAVGGFTSMTGVGLPTHTNITSNCAPCHNNVIAKGTASFSGHVSIGTSDCSSCHTPTNTSTYANFLGATAGHTMTAAAALNNCGFCHKNGGSGKMFTSQHIPSGTPSATDGSTTKVPAYQCDQCHTTAYTSMSFAGATMKHTSGTSYPASATCGGSAGCHNGSYTGEGTVGAQATTYVSNHIPTTITGTLDCNTCHTSAITISATAWTSDKMNHNAAQGGGTTPAGVYCVTCHLSSASYLGKMQKKSHNGASTTKDCSVSGCHKPRGSKGSAYSSWS